MAALGALRPTDDSSASVFASFLPYVLVSPLFLCLERILSLGLGPEVIQCDLSLNLVLILSARTLTPS